MFTFTPGPTPALPSSTAPFFFNPDMSAKLLGEAEDAGFGGVVIDDSAGPLANFDLVEQASKHSASVNLLLTHAAGVMSPAIAAQQISLLDRRTHGRLMLRMTLDGARDGLVAAHEETCRRTDEYLTLLPYVEAGVGEFMVSGAETPGLMRLVAGDTASLLRNSIARLPPDQTAPHAATGRH